MAVGIPTQYAIFPGNTAEFTVTALLADGVTPFNLTGASVNWMGKLAPEFSWTVFNKSSPSSDIVIPTPANGQINLWNRPIDTATLAPYQSIYNYVTVTDASGNVYTIEEFIVFIRD